MLFCTVILRAIKFVMFGSTDGRYWLSSVGVIGIEEVKHIIIWKSSIYVIDVYLLKRSSLFETRIRVGKDDFAIR